MSSIAAELAAVNRPDTPIAAIVHVVPTSSGREHGEHAGRGEADAHRDLRPEARRLRRVPERAEQAADREGGHDERAAAGVAVALHGQGDRGDREAAGAELAQRAARGDHRERPVRRDVPEARRRWCASIDACGSPATGRSRSGIVPRAEQRAAGHEERGEPGRAERGRRGDRRGSRDRAEVVGERVDRVGAALLGDDLGDEARQAAHDERRRDAGDDEGERDDARRARRRGRRRPVNAAAVTSARAGHERAGCAGAVEHGADDRGGDDARARGPPRRAARRARRRRAARRPAPGSPRDAAHREARRRGGDEVGRDAHSVGRRVPAGAARRRRGAGCRAGSPRAARAGSAASGASW